MTEPIIDLLSLLLLVIVGLLIWAALAPFEALGWWAGWFGHEVYTATDSAAKKPSMIHTTPDCYVIFLSGVARVSGEALGRREQNFLRRLAAAMPRAVIIDDIFPYSVNNLALTGQPVFAGLWRWALRRKLSGHWLETLAGYLINLRNIWQIAISADRRYGPIYNQAIAHVLAHGLVRHGYQADDRTPVILIGYSGAGQIAVGAATYLKEQIESPIFVVSLGGIFGSDPGLLAADHIYHLHGAQDRPQLLGSILFPGRWPILAYSSWNKARREGRITTICMGDMSHGGSTGYFTTSRCQADGATNLDKTVQTIATLPYALLPVKKQRNRERPQA